MKQLNQWYCIVFCTLLIAFCVINVATPQKAFSDNENRPLAQYPALDGESLVSGSFMKDFESYATDQFFGRDFFISLKAGLEQFSGKKENNDVYFAKDDYLIQKIPAWNMNTLKTNIAAIQKLHSLAKFRIHVALVPTAYEIYREKLPAFAYQPIQPQIVNQVSEALSGAGISVIDPSTLLKQHEGEYLYYRTDHHQTAWGGFYTYQSLAPALGFVPLETEDFTIREMSDAFYGTTWSEATLPNITPDSIYLFEPKAEVSFRTEFNDTDKIIDGLYDLSALEQKDKYVTYLGGNHPITKVTSSLQNGKKLAVFKDSYAHNIVPFLANHFEEIHMIDPRYYNLDAVAYLKEHDVTDVLILYSSANFASDTNLFKISAYIK